MKNYKFKTKSGATICVGYPINTEYLCKVEYDSDFGNFYLARRETIDDADVAWMIEEIDYCLFNSKGKKYLLKEGYDLNFYELFDLYIGVDDKYNIYAKLQFHLENSLNNTTPYFEIKMDEEEIKDFYYYLCLVFDEDEDNENIKILLDNKKILDDTQYYIVYVTFYQNGKEYAYLCDDESIEEECYVRVPVGVNDEIKVAKVERADYYSEDECEYDIKKMKKVIGVASIFDERYEE